MQDNVKRSLAFVGSGLFCGCPAVHYVLKGTSSIASDASNDRIAPPWSALFETVATLNDWSLVSSGTLDHLNSVNEMCIVLRGLISGNSARVPFACGNGAGGGIRTCVHFVRSEGHQSSLARTLKSLVGELRIELSPRAPKARMQRNTPFPDGASPAS